MKTSSIIVKTESKSYPIYFGNDFTNTLGKFIKKNIPNTKKVFIISDKNLPTNILKKISRSLKIYNTKVYKVKVTEKLKSFKVANKFIEDLSVFLNIDINEAKLVLGDKKENPSKVLNNKRILQSNIQRMISNNNYYKSIKFFIPSRLKKV